MSLLTVLATLGPLALGGSGHDDEDRPPVPDEVDLGALLARLEELERRVGVEASAEPGATEPDVPRARTAYTDDWRRPGDTNVVSLDDWELAFGIQYRLMYDASNLPGPAGTTATNTRDYDFARQRLRLNLDVAPKGTDVGAFVQVEFRGGSGGTGPGATDPRAEEPRLNAFNFIDFRGLRYGYVYWSPSSEHQLSGGILPVSDRFGDTLFSADWDWNLAGLAWHGACERSRYRVALLHAIEGVGSASGSTIDGDGAMLVADLEHTRGGEGSRPTVGLGAHAYALHVDDELPLGATQEVWLGPSVHVAGDGWSVEGGALVNFGELGVGVLAPDGTVSSGFDGDASSHVGYGLRVEGRVELGDVELRGLLVHTSGDDAGDVERRFVTPQGLFGTAGYWSYAHIFGANGPSDVNDLQLEIGNGGAGLVTAQAQVAVPLFENVGLTLAGGWFEAVEPRNDGTTLGVEGSLALSLALGGPLILDLGIAGADLGDFYGRGADSLYEVFARLQLQH